jgi:uncharacterized RDD family membrane protein YckC
METPKTTSAPPAPVQAGMAVRLAALVYDGLLLVAVNAIVAAIIVPLGTPAAAKLQHELVQLPQWYRHFVQMPAHLLVTFLFYGYFWKLSGQTLGMQTWRIQLTRADGQRAGWEDGLRRFLAALMFPVLCGAVARFWGSNGAFVLAVTLGFLANYLWIYANPARLAWHDQLSRTVVWRLPPEPRDKQRKAFGLFSVKD